MCYFWGEVYHDKVEKKTQKPIAYLRGSKEWDN